MPGKKNILAFVIVMIMLVVVTVSCGSDDQILTKPESIKNVEILKLESIETDVVMVYSGVVKPDDSKNYSFRNSGEIEDIKVEVGDSIKKGDYIGSLNTEDLELQVDVANDQLNMVIMDKVKAEKLYNFNKGNYENTLNLYKSGVSSKNQLDNAEISFRNSEISLNQMNGMINTAQIDLDYKKSLINDTDMIADSDGVVISVNNKVGDRISAGMPIIAIRNNTKKITMGVSGKDMVHIKLNMPVQIELNNKSVIGTIINISELPDNMTRMYEVDIKFDNTEVMIGTIVEVKVAIGKEVGIWIPLNSIMSSNIDYVYLVEDGKSVKKSLIIERVDDAVVKVKGLEENDHLVIKGMKSLKHGNVINIVNE